MTEFLKLLEQIEEAVNTHQPELADSPLAALEAALAATPPTAKTAAILRPLIARLATRTHAAADGVAFARAQIEQILKLAGRFESYDQNGQLHSDRLPTMAGKKY